MFNFHQRITTIGSFFMTVTFSQLFVVALTNILLVYLYGQPQVYSLKPHKINLKLGRLGGSRTQSHMARISFDLDADLTTLFNWNTKMLFVSVLVEHSNKNYSRNQACIWDDYILSKDDAVLKLKKKRSEYPVYDMIDSLPNSKANLTLQYQIIPWVGFMVTHRHVVQEFQFPDSQKTKKKAK